MAPDLVSHKIKQDKKAAQLQSKKALKQMRETQKKEDVDYMGYFILCILIFVTVFTRPNWRDKVSVHHVWYYGWITAISTGFGAIPFYFFPEPNKFWMGVSNGRRRAFNYLADCSERPAM